MSFDRHGNYHPDFLSSHVRTVPRADLPATRNRAISTRDQGKAWQGIGGLWQDVNDSLSLMPEHLTHYLRTPKGAAPHQAIHPATATGPSAQPGMVGYHDYMALESRRYRKAVQDVRVIGACTQHVRPNIPVDNFMLNHSKQAAAATSLPSTGRQAGLGASSTSAHDWERVAPSVLERITRYLGQCLRGLNGLDASANDSSSRANFGLFAPPPKSAALIQKPGWGSSSSAGADSFLNAHFRSVSSIPRNEAMQPYERREMMTFGGYDGDSYMIRHAQRMASLNTRARRVKPQECPVAEMPAQNRRQQTFELYLREVEKQVEAPLQA